MDMMHYMNDLFLNMMVKEKKSCINSKVLTRAMPVGRKFDKAWLIDISSKPEMRLL
jgi:hypothetical protein